MVLMHLSLLVSRLSPPRPRRLSSLPRSPSWHGRRLGESAPSSRLFAVFLLSRSWQQALHTQRLVQEGRQAHRDVIWRRLPLERRRQGRAQPLPAVGIVLRRGSEPVAALSLGLERRREVNGLEPDLGRRLAHRVRARRNHADGLDRDVGRVAAALGQA